MKKQRLVSLIILLTVFVYTILRYNVFRDTPWLDVPLYISNKAIALSAVLFIAFSYILGPIKKIYPKLNDETLSWRKEFGMIGFALAAVHTFISTLLFGPTYFGRLFEDTGRLNPEGVFSMFFGILAIFIFTIVSVTSVKAVQKDLAENTWLKIQRLGYIAFLIVFLHIAAMGYQGWFDERRWTGIMAPIGLIAAMAIILTVIIRTISKLKKN